MSKAFEKISALDRLIHEPTRLAILTALRSCESADFLFLQHLIGLTKGNLSSHLSKLEEASLVKIEKKFVGKKTNTVVRLTEAGTAAIEQHWQKLQELHQDAFQWKPEQ